MAHVVNRLWTLLALTLAMVAPKARGQIATQQANTLALRLYDVLSAEDATSNVFFSPLSIATAFAFVHLGTRGVTRQQLDDVFGFGTPGVAEALRKGSLALGYGPNDGTELLLANKLFVEKTLELQDSFRTAVENTQSTGLDQVDFFWDPEGSRRLINEYVSRATRGIIDELLARGFVTTATVLVIANALFFQGAWQFPFNEAYTTPMPFYGFNGGSAFVPMMWLPPIQLRIGRVSSVSEPRPLVSLVWSALHVILDFYTCYMWNTHRTPAQFAMPGEWSTAKM